MMELTTQELLFTVPNGHQIMRLECIAIYEASTYTHARGILKNNLRILIEPDRQ